uniref:Uncharacterized protein n=1 Tax=Anopheles dirus TaxID=7168 RepID=A0A182NXK8_9DIPT
WPSNRSRACAVFRSVSRQKTNIQQQQRKRAISVSGGASCCLAGQNKYKKQEPPSNGNKQVVTRVVNPLEKQYRTVVNAV